MNFEALRERFEFSPDALAALVSVGLLPAEANAGDEKNYDERDIECIKEALTLKSAGIETPVIRELIERKRKGNDDPFRRVQLFSKHRREQLDALHSCQETIDRLDFLIRDAKRECASVYGKDTKI